MTTIEHPTSNTVWKKLLWTVLLLFCLAAVGASVQSLVLSGKPDGAGGLTMKYNNYLIFKHSYFNLLEDKDLYALYPEKARDYFKYSPTFALMFGILAYFPDAIGLVLWNLLNVLLVFIAIRLLPSLTDKAKALLLAFVFFELLTSIQNSQSNGLIAGILILAFVFLEKGKLAWATLLIILSVYIKLFGIFALLLLLFYPNKGKASLYTAGWFLLLLIVPGFVTGFDQLLFQYKSWYQLLIADHSASLGISVAGVLHSALPSIAISNKLILLIGLVALLLPLLKVSQYKEYSYRLLFLGSVLIWTVIFNHKAESPTFIIAMTGVGLWYFGQEKNNLNLALLLFALLLTSISSTDLFPASIRENVVNPYNLKALPCILVWLKLTVDLFTVKARP
jgi:hypothetical protein